MDTILKATTKGQITLPSKWRKKFSTDRFLVTFEDDVLRVQPLDIKKAIKKSNDKTKVVFNAVRDNKGRGVDAKSFLKALKSING